MATAYSAFFCPKCGQQQLFVREKPNHLIHCLVTLFLFGLWLPIWVAATIFAGGWHCSVCGGIPEPYYLKRRRIRAERESRKQDEFIERRVDAIRKYYSEKHRG